MLRTYAPVGSVERLGRCHMFCTGLGAAHADFPAPRVPRAAEVADPTYRRIGVASDGLTQAGFGGPGLTLFLACDISRNDRAKRSA